MYDNIVFRTFVKITYCDKAFLIKDYHLHQLTGGDGDVLTGGVGDVLTSENGDVLTWGRFDRIPLRMSKKHIRRILINHATCLLFLQFC